VSHHHGHDHAPQHFGRAFAIGIGLNTLYVAVEAIIGLRIGSLGLVADAGHNASDVLALILAWVGAHLAQRPPSARFSYGLKRSPIVASLFNALLLFSAMGIVAWEAFERLQRPAELAGGTIVWVTLIGLVVNFGTAMLFVRGRHDLNVRGAFLHMIADGLVTLGVLLGGVAIIVTGATWIDPAISLLIVAVVLVGTWGLFRDALRLSLDAVPAGIDPGAVRRYLADLPGVSDVHDLHIWPLSTTEAALTAHLVIPEHDGDSNPLIRRACSELHDRFEIVHTTLQIERDGPDDPCGRRLSECR
jgi:cobalt-zinc-cadmium efflux system protein